MANQEWHRNLLEHRAAVFAGLTTAVISVGGLVEIAPMYSASVGPQTLAGVTPYTPLELGGRDIYLREGCYNCHSQMVRPFRSETLRYGPWTRAGEYIYDHPFQLGSKRNGPDLQRVGGKYPDAWHYEHMRNPRSLSPDSIMPTYPWLYEDRIDPDDIAASVVAMRRVGVPYTDQDVAGVASSLTAQEQKITASLASAKIQTDPDREIIALIAYLQRAGRDGQAAISAQEAARKAAGANGATP